MKLASPTRTIVVALFAGLASTAVAAADFDAELNSVQTEWATMNYATPEGSAREKACDRLIARAGAFSAANSARPEALIWHGIVLSTCAGVKGGLGALGMAKDAKARLEAALKIDPRALDGSAYTSLGTLYHKVPGFPIGFGSDKKARQLLQKALQINPDGIDPNYFYAELLFDDDDYAGAMKHLEKALKAPPRPTRRSADEGRRREIEALMARVKAELS